MLCSKALEDCNITYYVVKCLGRLCVTSQVMCSRALENGDIIDDVFNSIGRLVNSHMATHMMSLMLIFPLFHVQGAGTTESVLTEMFASRTNKQIVAFTAAYLAGKLPLWPYIVFFCCYFVWV